MLIAEEEAAEVTAGLLVGHGCEDHVPLELLALAHVAREEGHDAGAHRGHVLHVDRAAAPHVAVVDLAAERIVLPLRRVGLDDVEVRVEEERGLGAVAPEARDHVRAALGLREELRLQAGIAEMIGHALGADVLVAVALVTGAAIDARHADEIAQQRDARVALGAPVRRGGHRQARA